MTKFLSCLRAKFFEVLVAHRTKSLTSRPHFLPDLYASASERHNPVYMEKVGKLGVKRDGMHIVPGLKMSEGTVK